MGLRLFAAVLPPPDVINELDDLLEPRRDVDPTLRWTRPDGWHLTTAFMASVPEGRLERLEENLADVAERTPAFTVSLAGGLAFPHPIRARVLTLAVGVGHMELAALSERCRHAATKAGVEVDGSRFVGHLTLARHNRGLQATRWLGVLDSFPRWECPVEELCLLRSGLGGGRYEVLERFPLTAPRHPQDADVSAAD